MAAGANAPLKIVADPMRASSAEPNPWLHRFAWFTAAATLLLICSGGMVTSKGVGLAVPDWPTTFGYNMFLFPVSKWIGGVLFEHTHRLIASTVGFLTIILALWLWRVEDRPAVKTLGLIVLIAIVTANFWRSLALDLGLRKIAPIKTLALATTIAIYVQLALGAT